jgi:tetratricopeptide (TPR) repeat protein
MLRTLFVAIVMLAVAGPALADDDVDTCRDRQADAKMRLDACEKIITSGQAKGQDLGVAYEARGQAFMHRRNYDKAIAAFDAAHAADPDNTGYIDARGWAYESKGDDEHAMADYNSVLSNHANDAVVLNHRGTLYMRTGVVQSALDDFTAAANYRPKFLAAHINRARALTATGDYDGALAEFTAAEQIDPGGTRVPAYRCLTYTIMHKFDEAIADCNIVVEKLPKYQGGRVSRADAYRVKGDLDAALKDYNFVLGVNPNNVRAHAGRGQLYEKRRDLEQARADYRSAAVAARGGDDYDVGQARQVARERLEALTAQGPGQATGRRIALVIGNGAYKNAPQLDNPPRDAKLIADTLREIGFQSVTLANDLTRDKFFDALHTFGREAEKADWAVIYYAGHGLEIGGVNYLVPVDAKLAADKDAETETVALEQVIAAAGGARRLRLLMLDACRDNPFAPTMQRTIALKLVDKGLSDIEPSAGFMVVYAAKHGETALDGDGVDSPFAVAVARDVQRPRVEVRKLFDIVRDDVWDATKHQQQPFTYGSPAGKDDFYFVAGK